MEQSNPDRMEEGGQLNLALNKRLSSLPEEDNDAILVELCDRLEQRVNVRISRQWDASFKSSSSPGKNSACN